MILTASFATERNWCNYCTDLIVEGEIVASHPELRNPFGEQGYAHADCAERNGYELVGDTRPASDEARVRRAFRGHADGLEL